MTFQKAMKGKSTGKVYLINFYEYLLLNNLGINNI